ncbi:9959_t:CDS:1 [Cetraspora pellucida]|uniref:9959_t:CDS:1 n=1 Tax=Cetraspora pellucida TaxID=1433469 RepID=A0A9N9JB77_9GLOM|nr:9959_t:CDS:1 [Cetraspora pellucida]
MTEAQEWLDQNYPKEKRNDIISLECKDNTLKLIGELLLDNFCGLVELDLSLHDITKLDVSDCYELERIIFANNILTSLPGDFIYPEKLTYLNIMNNNIDKIDLNYFCKFINLKTLFIGTNDKYKMDHCFYNRFYGHLRSLKDLTQLEALDISNTDISKGLSYLPDSLKDFRFRVYRPEAKVAKIKEKLEPFGEDFKKYKKTKSRKLSYKRFVKNNEVEEVQEQSAEIKNLLIVGRTGNGKSALANVLSDTSRFKESEKSISETRKFLDEIFTHNGTTYRVVDTIGMGDNRLSKNDVLIEITEAVYAIKEGINQILFVVGRRFTKEEIDAFELIKGAIFESNIIKHTTIIRTNFPNFKNSAKCKEDRQDLFEGNEFLAEMLNSCNGIIHVDNPSVEVECERRLAFNREDRENSRKKILDHLENFKENYKPDLMPWDQLYLKVRNYMKIKHNLQRSDISSDEANTLKAQMEKLEEKVVRETDLHYAVPPFAKLLISYNTCQIL